MTCVCYGVGAAEGGGICRGLGRGRRPPTLVLKLVRREMLKRCFNNIPQSGGQVKTARCCRMLVKTATHMLKPCCASVVQDACGGIQLDDRGKGTA